MCIWYLNREIMKLHFTDQHQSWLIYMLETSFLLQSGVFLLNKHTLEHLCYTNRPTVELSSLAEKRSLPIPFSWYYDW